MQIKINQDSGHFSGYPINMVASFAEHLELRESKRFTRGGWVTSEKVKSTIKNQDTLHTEDSIYTLLHKKKNIDASFTGHTKCKNKNVLNMELVQLVSNENQKARFRTFSTLKMIHTVCSIKGATILLFQWSTKSFQKEKFFTWNVSSSDRLK